MKSLSILLILFSAQAYAANPFVGKFAVDHANCTETHLQSAERVYIGFGNEFGANVLDVKAYGEDASSFSILLGSGARQLPGTDIKIHSVVTQRWQTQVRGNTLTSYATVDRPSIRYHGVEATQMVDYGQVLVIQSSTNYGPGQPNQATYCRLLRSN